jgi:hypothetical protein
MCMNASISAARVNHRDLTLARNRSTLQFLPQTAIVASGQGVAISAGKLATGYMRGLRVTLIAALFPKCGVTAVSRESSTSERST